MHPEEARPTLARSPFYNQRIARNLLRLSALAVFLGLSTVVVAGCGIFDPKKSGGIPPEPPAVYVMASYPDHVLLNLEEAYSKRDSVGYKVIYDSSYVGTSQDLGDPPGTTPISLFYTDEVAHVATLASKPTINSAFMDLGAPASWDRLESSDPSHPEWAVIQISGSNLNIQVTEGPDTYETSGVNEFFEFAFKPTTPAPGSPSDTLWKIVRWTESRAAGP